MPIYSTSPFADQPKKMIPGQPLYLFGSWNGNVSPTKLAVSKVALATNVATLTVKVIDGNVPIVGALITVAGSANTSGLFNVTNVALTGVSLDISGAGTVTFALTHADVTAIADAGTAIVPQPEIGETVVNGNSIAGGAPYSTPFTSDGVADTVQCEVSFPTIPTGCVVALQGALVNQDANYRTIVANVVTVATSSATYGTLSFTGKFNFYRFNISGTGGSGTICAKINL